MDPGGLYSTGWFRTWSFLGEKWIDKFKHHFNYVKKVHSKPHDSASLPLNVRYSVSTVSSCSTICSSQSEKHSRRSANILNQIPSGSDPPSSMSLCRVLPSSKEAENVYCANFLSALLPVTASQMLVTHTHTHTSICLCKQFQCKAEWAVKELSEPATMTVPAVSMRGITSAHRTVPTLTF